MNLQFRGTLFCGIQKLWGHLLRCFDILGSAEVLFSAFEISGSRTRSKIATFGIHVGFVLVSLLKPKQSCVELFFRQSFCYDFCWISGWFRVGFSSVWDGCLSALGNRQVVKNSIPLERQLSLQAYTLRKSIKHRFEHDMKKQLGLRIVFDWFWIDVGSLPGCKNVLKMEFEIEMGDWTASK